MKNQKLLLHLKMLSHSELSAFSQWLRSPALNSNRNLSRLFDYLKKSAPEYLAPRLKAERVHDHLYPAKAFDYSRVKRLSTELIKQLYEFWLFQQQAQDTEERDLVLWKLLDERGLTHFAASLQERNRSALFGEGLLLESRNLLRFGFAAQEHQKIIDAGQRDNEPKLQQVSDSLDRFYFYEKLKYYCSALMQKRFTDAKYDFRLMEEIQRIVALPEFQQFPGIQFYRHVIITLTEKQEAADLAFQHMKLLLHNQLRKSEGKEMKPMLLVARNYCIQQLNTRRTEYLQEIFELYQLEIELGLIYVQGKIPPASYKNIGTVAMHLKRFDWLDDFLESNRSKVAEESYLFNRGILRFSQRRFVEAMELFTKAEPQEVLMNLSAKAWLVKTYYELFSLRPQEGEYDELLESHITAFTTFLNRKRRALPDHYIFHLNLGKFVRELLRHSRPYQFNEEKLRDLQSRAEASQQIAERRWLLRKLRECLGDEERAIPLS